MTLLLVSLRKPNQIKVKPMNHYLLFTRTAKWYSPVTDSKPQGLVGM